VRQNISSAYARERIGYVVREVLAEVNEAIYNNKILGESFE